MDADKFWACCKKSDGCWEWKGRPCTSGYGQTGIGGRLRLAHRVAYELANGPIPDGLHIDHICCNRICVNPAHLQAVTQAENQRLYSVRRTHCRAGHELTLDNIYKDPKTPRRHCRECRRIYNARVMANKLAAQLQQEAT